jgi:hypothetical protein
LRMEDRDHRFSIFDSLRSGCRLLIVRSCARRHRELRQVRKEAAVPEQPLCHGAT